MRIPHGLRAVAGVNVSTPWDLGRPRYVSSFSVATEETTPQDLYITQNHLFIIGNTSQGIHQYSISNWDIATASYVRTLSVATYEGTPLGLFFRSNGTVVYWIGQVTDSVYQSTLSTAWDISTAGTPASFSVSAKETAPNGLFFRSDGLNMFVTGGNSDSVHKYVLSTAWDVTSASFSQSFSVLAEDTAARGVHFKDDGTKMYMVGATADSVFQYDLTTAWDLSTATLEKSFSVAAQDTAPNGVFFKDDGTKMYVIGNTNDSVYTYNL